MLLAQGIAAGCGDSGGKASDAVEEAGSPDSPGTADIEAGSLDVRGPGDVAAHCPGDPCGATFTIANNSPAAEFLDPERPLEFFVQEEGQWTPFLPTHGCVGTCEPCEDFSCSGCYDMQAIAAGSSMDVVWDGRMWGRDGLQQCISEGQGAVDCYNWEFAPAGRYKVALSYAWKWHEGTCTDDDYPSLASPSMVEVEFDYPVEGPVSVLVAIPADTTQRPPWPAGESVTVLEHKLPSPRAGLAIATPSSSQLWIVGGDAGGATLGEVVQYDPKDGATALQGVVLPVPIKAGCAAWVEAAGSMLVVGGMAASGPTDAIQQCTSTGCELLPSPLPGKRGLTACFANSAGQVLVLGGNGGPAGMTDQVVSVDAATGTVTVEPAKLPTPRASRIGALTAGDRAYFLGGLVQAGKTDEILDVDPLGKAAPTAAGKLPMAMDGGAYVWTGTKIVVLGGEPLTGPTNAILLVDPAAGVTTPSELKLPAALRGTAAGIIDGAVYLFGGNSPTGLTDQIIRYVPAE
jgi:hypothetical protein